MKKIMIVLVLILNTMAFSVKLSDNEMAWIEKNRDTKIDINFILPRDIFMYVDENEEIQGVYRDFFERIKRDTNLKFNMVNFRRENLEESIKKEDYLAIYLKLAKNSDREEKFYFHPMENTFGVILIKAKNSELKGENDISQKRVGIISRTSEERKFITHYGNENYVNIEVKDMKEGFRMIDTGEIDYFLGKTEYINSSKYSFDILSNVARLEYSMAIPKEYHELNSIIEKYVRNFRNEVVSKSIRENRVKYYKGIIKNNPDYFKIKERYSSIKILLQKERYLMPLYYEKKGEFQGYIPDQYRVLSEILDIPVEFIRLTDEENIPEYHVRAFSTLQSPNHKQLYPFYEMTNMILGKTDSDFITDLSELKKYKVGAKELLSIPKAIKGMTETIDSYDTAIEGILNGTYDYVIGDFKILSMIVSNKYLRDELKFVGHIPKIYSIHPEVPLENEELINIMEIVFKPHSGEGYILKKNMDNLVYLNPNHQKYGTIFLLNIFIMGILLYFFLYNRKENQKKDYMMNSLIESFEMANNYNDEDTGMHITRVNAYAKVLAEKYGGTRKFINEVGKYSSLHDVGKIGIPDAILKKPGKLTEEEMDVMKTHVDIGYELIKKMKLGILAENIVRYHHEKWDGSGYNSKLKGELIPLEARIVALADVYDALRQKRSYKEEFTHEKAVQIIKEESGKSFDPTLVKLFLSNNNIFEDIFNKSQ